ncbi:lipopolysaccharide biosynthesis protein [Vagococcus fluvialis]|uniref:lipopolysaccharide biosynthesis protein n=1 Tax=Vagococcus fluvialis TaxID=2738 RepID=UPI003B58CD44
MKKKIVFDSFFNIIATAIPIIALQLVILPIIGLRLGQNEYGLVITFISITTVFSIPFGNVLNNLRLLVEDEYQENRIVGDFNYLLLVSLMINSILVIIILFFMKNKIDIIDFSLLLLMSGLNIIREYFLVSFRLELNYRKILENNFYQAIGYLIGVLIFFIIPYWELIYISGFLLSIYFILKNSKLHKESLSKTIYFKSTLKKSVVLFISTFLKTFITYADRLLLFPLLGATAVSIYYSSSVVGKILGMAIMPISGVLLSYLRNSKELSNKKFFKMCGILIIISIIGYFIINWVSIPVLKILYPKWYLESQKLISINTATALIITMTSIIHPFILKFRDIKWQMIINIVNLISYMLFIYIFYYYFGLLGFCVGILLSNFLKLLLMVYIYTCKK